METFDKLSVAIRDLDFVDLDREIKRTMRRSAKDVIQIGYMLKQMRDKKLWEVQYSCLDEYLKQELGIDYTAASRFMNLNSKYSLRGNSMEIAAEYANYSQGLLIEMLSMPPELEEKVTPEMTVKQVREIKRSAKPKKEPVPKTAEVIVDGEYREVDEKKDEIVATSQSPDKGNDKPRKCITGMSKYGSCVCCGVDGIQCCAQCGEDCNSRCGWLPERSDKRETPDDELSKLRKLLCEKKKELDECVKIDKVEPLPEGYVYERKIIVGALAGMLHELEDAAEQPKQEPEQMELPLLKNNDQRKEWLEKYKDWGLWYHDEHIDVNYYKYDFNDGSRLVVTEYPQRHCYWEKGKEDQYYYHLLEKRYKGYGDIVYDRQYNNSTDSETYLVNFLKNLQKGDKKA